LSELDALLELSRSIATEVGQRLLSVATANPRYAHQTDLPREVKAEADVAAERDILSALKSTGLPILSEESGYISGPQQSGYWFIVDPLDGTFNFVKRLGPCAVSIALWDGEKPLFGVVHSVVDRQLFWGGPGLGAFRDGEPISVSDTADKARSSICTGFPARFNVESETARQTFWDTVKPFAKVRMIGSAAASLLHVATGAADAYAETNIMLWDVAAGLAIVEGAGGTFTMNKTAIEWSYDVVASNARLCNQRT
jgi:myo-inositol-1(or 4)-monophosphatase